MYSYIKGTLEEIEEDKIVVENQGIGYNIFVPGRILEELPQIGSSVKIYTYFHVKEDCLWLFGFLNKDEITLFKMMLNVSGIGPKGALGILTVLSPDDLCAAVISENAKAIAKAPGVGNKTAQKLIIELKDKVHLEDILDHGENVVSSENGNDALSSMKNEAVEALASLGYSVKEAQQAVGMIEIADQMSTEDILKAALRNMAFL